MNTLYIGDNIKFAGKLKKQFESLESSVRIKEVIDTKKYSLDNPGRLLYSGCYQCQESTTSSTPPSIIDKIFDIESTVDALIIQGETFFSDCNRRTYDGSNGIELAKHIILSQSPSIERKKIIILSLFDSHYHIKAKADNIIVLSPYVTLMQMCLSPNEMATKIEEKVRYYDREIMMEGEDYYKNLKNYVIVLPTEYGEDNHNERNLRGIQSLYRELFINDHDQYCEKFINEVVITNEAFKQDIWKLSHKKIDFRYRLKWEEEYNNALLSVNERKDYAQLLNTVSDGLTLNTCTKWKSLFDKEIYAIRQNLGSNCVTIIEDKSYWKNFYTNIFGNEVNWITNNVGAESCFNKYQDSIISNYNTIISAFMDSVKNAKKFEHQESLLPDFPNMAIIDIYLSNDDEKIETPSGIKLISDLRRINSLIPIFVCSASKNSERIRKAIKCGASEFFTKDTGGLRYFLYKTYSLSILAKEKKLVGELINFLNNGTSVPCLIENDDDSWHFVSQESVPTIKEMPRSDRFHLSKKLESIFENSNANDIPTLVLQAIRTTFSIGEEFKYNWDMPLIEWIYDSLSVSFNSKGKRKVAIDSHNIIIIDTKGMFLKCKPVESTVTSNDQAQKKIHVKIDNTEYYGFINWDQAERLGYAPDRIKGIKKGDKLSICREKSKYINSNITETNFELVLLKINDGNEGQGIL